MTLVHPQTYSPTPYAPNQIATYLVAAWQSGKKSIKVEPNHYLEVRITW